MATSNAASDPLYYDVSPKSERNSRLFFIVSGLACVASIICVIVKAQEEKNFYAILISLISSILFVLCIFVFFKRRILLAEKLWFVNLTIFILLLQALIYLIFVLIKPYPIITTTATTMTTTYPTTTMNTTNGTNITTTATTTQFQSGHFQLYSFEKQLFLQKLYQHIEDD